MGVPVSDMDAARASKGRRWMLGLGIAALLLVLAFSVPWKLNFVRGWVGEKVTEATGRSFVIDGDVWWRWGAPSRLSVDGLRLGNADWASKPEMVSAQRLEADVVLSALLRGKVALQQVRAVKLDVQLEVAKDGVRNWDLDRDASNDDGEALVVGSLVLDEGRLGYLEPARDTAVEARIQSVNEAGTARLKVDADGSWRGLPLKAAIVGDGILQLRDDSKPFALRGEASFGRTEARFDGTLTAPAKPTAANIAVSLKGPSFGQWYRITGVGVPDTPPYDTHGQVVLDQGRWSYKDFEARIGRSELGGTLSYEDRAARPFLGGRLVAKSLDLKDFEPVIGAQPKTQTEGAPAAAPKDAAATRRVLPQGRFSAARWNSLDADLQFDGQAVRNVGSFPIDKLNFHLKLDDRRITLEPMSLRAGGGGLDGRLLIDGRATPIQASVSARLDKLQLATLLPQLQAAKGDALGALNGRIELAGTGDSFAALLGSANGEAQVAMGKGRMSNLLIELLDLDAFEALAFLVRGDRDVQIRCALVDVGFQQGLMQTRAAVFDTVDTVIETRGSVNFANEGLDLRVTPLPKDLSPLTARVPFDVKGSFAAPQVSPDKAGLIARGGGAVLLGLINPLAALIPLIETGPGEDQDCAGLQTAAKQKGVNPAAANGGSAR